MKVWENAAVVEMKIAETQHGGTASMSFDNSWHDGNGALHVQFSGVVVESQYEMIGKQENKNGLLLFSFKGINKALTFL